MNSPTGPKMGSQNGFDHHSHFRAIYSLDVFCKPFTRDTHRFSTKRPPMHRGGGEVGRVGGGHSAPPAVADLPGRLGAGSRAPFRRAGALRRVWPGVRTFLFFFKDTFFSPVGFKGKPSLLELFLFFPGVLKRWKQPMPPFWGGGTPMYRACFDVFSGKQGFDPQPFQANALGAAQECDNNFFQREGKRKSRHIKT